MGVEAEEVVEACLGGVHLGEHPAGTGAAAFALVEQHGLLDAGEGEHAVEGVDADLLVGRPVPTVGARSRS